MNPNQKSSLLLLGLLSAAAPVLLAAEAESPTPDQLAFFEKKIRPVLVEHCYKCHSEKSEKVRGGLVLDTREGIRRGGDNGPAVVPGDLKESLLIQAIQYTNKDFAMPPEKSGGKLPEAVIKDFETWVSMGAPDPRDGAAKVVKKYDAEEAKKWWSFQPVQKPSPPVIKDTAWPQGELDRFVLAGLEAKELKPAAPADKLTLLRRVYFDLIGLPPSTSEVDAFVQDTAPDALAKVVDRLLASPQFGERWGRHWLDVARYAESSGKDINVTFPHAWRYRDYVIQAFNDDKPYDQFLREQIAGDLLPAKDDRQRADQLVATGFLAIGTKGLNELNPRQFAMDLADEQIDTVSQAVLGLTVACARCHDHKFDPVSQREYHAMAGIFLSTETRYGTALGIQNRHSSALLELPAYAGARKVNRTMPAAERARKEAQLETLKKEQRELFAERFQAFRNGGANGSTPNPQRGIRALLVLTQVGLLEADLNSFDASGQPKVLAMGVVDRPSEAPDLGPPGRFRQAAAGRYRQPDAFRAITDSPLFARGEVDKPGEKVPRGFLALLTHGEPPAIAPKTSGRRELAEWLVTPENPLTARVMANRLWHWLFGQGIVSSVDNFGTMGQKPSNAPLLDHLATRLVANGWSMKMTIREIVLSRTYQMSSGFDQQNFVIDPENTLVWRQNKRRLDAECIRDAMLSTSGTLDLKAPAGSLIAMAGEGPIGPRRLFGITEEAIINASGATRSIYLPIARDVLPDSLAVFDYAENSLVNGARETTNVPSQALFLLNSSFVTEQSRKLAERILQAYPGDPNAGSSANLDQRLIQAFWLTYSRPPTAAEKQAATTFFNRFPSNWEKRDKSTSTLLDPTDMKAAWTSFCRALFGSAEFRYLN